ncbi:hypothetical protein [Nostoc sp.]|uniref:hypothetical protein n=1 Tax=Nostoc sp. TaxID=1180 RepID=UPI0035948651
MAQPLVEKCRLHLRVVAFSERSTVSRLFVRTERLLTAGEAEYYTGSLIGEAVLKSLFLVASGYVWKPYEGEVYKPLMASPDLKSKPNKLLAVG